MRGIRLIPAGATSARITCPSLKDPSQSQLVARYLRSRLAQLVRAPAARWRFFTVMLGPPPCLLTAADHTGCSLHSVMSADALCCLRLAPAACTALDGSDSVTPPAGALHVSKPTHWLESRFHFSFADYFNPNNQNFGALRVMNDDLVKAGNGFGCAHPPPSERRNPVYRRPARRSGWQR